MTDRQTDELTDRRTLQHIDLLAEVKKVGVIMGKCFGLLFNGFLYHTFS